MTITINIGCNDSVPKELVAQFVLRQVREQILNGEFARTMSGDYTKMNGIKYSVEIKPEKN
jgi:hypothetical protein